MSASAKTPTYLPDDKSKVIVSTTLRGGGGSDRIQRARDELSKRLVRV